MSYTVQVVNTQRVANLDRSQAETADAIQAALDDGAGRGWRLHSFTSSPNQKHNAAEHLLIWEHD